MFDLFKKGIDSAKDGIKKGIDYAKDGAVQVGLDAIKNKLINTKIEEYGRIKEISWKDNRLECVVNLLGMEEVDLIASCGHIHIWEDASKIQLGDFQANKQFLKNALDNYATREMDVPENEVLRSALLQLKKVLPG